MLEVSIVQGLIVGLLQAIPGIPAAVSAFVMQIVAQLPSLVDAGTDLKNFLDGQLAVVRTMIAENRDPTDDEWAALNNVVAGELVKLSNQANSA